MAYAVLSGLLRAIIEAEKYLKMRSSEHEQKGRQKGEKIYRRCRVKQERVQIRIHRTDGSS